MWRTPHGTRVIKGAESILLRESIKVMTDELVDERDNDHVKGMKTKYRVNVFDDLSMMQRLGLLHQVSRALLLESVPEPELTAVNEATLAAVINNVAQQIWFEFGDRGSTDEISWRQLLLNSNDELDDLRENDDESEKTLPTSCVKADWDTEIQVLAHFLLWDEDFDYEDLTDMDPDQAAALRESLDIEDDYYIAIPPDPPESQFDELVAEIRKLCDAPA